MESTSENRLCDVCATIPFLELHAKAQKRRTISGNGRSLSWFLGKVPDVRKRGYCPFCRLIYEGLERDLPDDSNIDIRWRKVKDSFDCADFPEDTKITFLDINHRFLDKRIDISRVHQWLSTCSEHHSNCLPHHSTLEVELPNFRVIDVRRKCIAAMPNSIRYVALSYVWGQVDTYQLLKCNSKDLMKSEGLTRNWEKLPCTIRDVILFTEAIGERYLWVDTLCLIQDDHHDKIPGIKHMDVVYSRAFCTIVAASGIDANAGIPGWGLIRRRAQHVSEVLPGINVILTKSINTYLNQTQYHKRAWTFQEYFLSPRRIIFIDSQVCYLCRNCCWREDDAQGQMLSSNISPDDSYMSVLNFTWMDDEVDTHVMLSNMLWHYTTRKLTYPSDILNAMDGIFRALSFRCKCSFFQGMPVAALDLYLLFNIAPTKRCRSFPSYSWTGWHGQIVFRIVVGSTYRHGFPDEHHTRKKNAWLSKHTWIVWYRCKPSTRAIARIWDINQNTGFSDLTENDIGYRNIRSFRPKRGKSRLSLDDATTDPSPLYDVIDQSRYPYPLLQFWTVAVYLNAAFWGPTGACLYHRNGVQCGSLFINSASIKPRLKEWEPVELIILSEHWENSGNSPQHFQERPTIHGHESNS
ncbi:hypothetical protein CKAH01_14483 [Colletotrichum kahawae]|uniref:Heterokaryon incompatibility domain-containing protein n=1 Tax=Colletotrichum kahawae TaxID=34407 RepID=A0AAD9YLT6_COLKA|nr:hypothetical protein CKAH01_14483 [Colletotrichum kahawae]